MAYSNGIITAPVSFYDVQLALGDSSQDLGTLCKSSKINMWARNKPMSINKLFGITESDKEKVNYGISNLSWVESYDACKGYIGQPETSNFTYLKPSGGSSSPYRMEDFIGYDSTATAPIYASNRTSLKQEEYSNGNKYVDVYINIRGYNNHPNWLNISYLDYRDPFGNIVLAAKNCYLGIVLQGANGTYQTISNAPVSLLTEGDQYDWGFRIEDRNCYGTFTVMPFLIETDTFPSPNQSGQQVVKCLPLTFAQSTVAIQQLVPIISISSISYTRTSYGNGYKLTITNIVISNTGSMGSITGISLTFIGQNITNVTNKNILLASYMDISSGNTTLTGSNFNDATCYTTSTSDIYGSLTISLLNGDTSIATKEKLFSGTIPASETF